MKKLICTGCKKEKLEDEFAKQIDKEYADRLVAFNEKLQAYKKNPYKEPLLPPWATAEDNDLSGEP